MPVDTRTTIGPGTTQPTVERARTTVTSHCVAILERSSVMGA